MNFYNPLLTHSMHLPKVQPKGHKPHHNMCLKFHVFQSHWNTCYIKKRHAELFHWNQWDLRVQMIAANHTFLLAECVDSWGFCLFIASNADYNNASFLLSRLTNMYQFTFVTFRNIFSSLLFTALKKFIATTFCQILFQNHIKLRKFYRICIICI